ncbi:MAG: DUF3040 domain-containing protein [Streptosporangiales bacterium]|jgi:hypothetical protein|nr:DUF3040 domain-containing protein [Streptosporangiales bacterium]
MILPPGQPQTLREIENRLSEADPGLAAMLTGFEADPGRARYRARRERYRYIIVMTGLWAMLAACLTMIAVTIR